MTSPNNDIADNVVDADIVYSGDVCLIDNNRIGIDAQVEKYREAIAPFYNIETKLEHDKELLNNIESGKTENSLNFDEIINKYSPLIGLIGDSYRFANKCIFYCVLSNQLKLNHFFIKNKKLDFRIPLSIIMKAGHGKKEYESFIKSTIKGIGKNYIEPSSYHPEQFIGKVLIKDDKYKTIPGILGQDFVVIDEGHKLLTDPQYDQSLTYIRTALDPIGNNWLEKKQVDVTYEDKLGYFPSCNIVILSQPITQINQELLTKGTLRRFLQVIVNSGKDERIKAFNESNLNDNTKEFDALQTQWNNLNLSLLKRVNLVFKCENFNIINDYIVKELYNIPDITPEMDEYTDTLLFNLKHLIFKMAAIRAILEQPGTNINISKQNIEDAIKDHKEAWKQISAWINQYLNANVDKGAKWTSKHEFVINILQKKGDVLQSEIQNLYIESKKNVPANTSLNYIRRVIKELKDWSYIKDDIVEGKKNARILKLLKKS